MVLCALEPTWTPSEVSLKLLWDTLSEHDIHPSTNCGKGADYFVRGGFQRFQVIQHERPVLVANHQGGYRVYCSKCGALVTSTFVGAIRVYRQGGERRLKCFKCGMDQDLNELEFRPPAAFTTFELQCHNVQDVVLTPAGHAFFEDWFDGFQIVLRRVG